MSKNCCTHWFKGVWNSCCCQHDKDYYDSSCSRKESDKALFRCVKKSCKFCFVIAFLMYIAVRLIGKRYWRQKQNIGEIK
jgi:hypothetical protein